MLESEELAYEEAAYEEPAPSEPIEEVVAPEAPATNPVSDAVDEEM